LLLLLVTRVVDGVTCVGKLLVTVVPAAVQLWDGVAILLNMLPDISVTNLAFIFVK